MDLLASQPLRGSDHCSGGWCVWEGFPWGAVTPGRLLVVGISKAGSPFAQAEVSGFRGDVEMRGVLVRVAALTPRHLMAPPHSPPSFQLGSPPFHWVAFFPLPL